MRLGVAHPKLVGVVEEMGLNLEDPLSQKELAFKAGISTRQLERLFSKYMGLTPTRYYLNLRFSCKNDFKCIFSTIKSSKFYFNYAVG